MPLDFCSMYTYYVIKIKGPVTYLNSEKYWDNTFLIFRISLVGDDDKKKFSSIFTTSLYSTVDPEFCPQTSCSFHCEEPSLSLFMGNGLGYETLKVLQPRPLILRGPMTCSFPGKHLWSLTTPMQVLPDHKCS